MIECYGEALVDLIVQPFSGGEMNTTAKPCLGGSVFNFCIAAQRQGMAARYLNALSSDMFGRQFARLLQGEGVRLADDAPNACPTSMAVVQLDEKGHASYAFHRENIADTARKAPEIIANLSSDANILHTGCLMLVPSAWPQTREIIRAARTRGRLISVDANMRVSVCPDLAAYRPSVLQACAIADIVKVSDDDLIALGLLQESEKTQEAALNHACQNLLSASEQTQLIALTLGERGAWVVNRSVCVKAAAPQGIVVKDTVGAGDSFIAALIAHLQSQGALNAQLYQAPQAPLAAALQHAIAAASICVERQGCDPATWAQSKSRSAQIQSI